MTDVESRLNEIAAFPQYPTIGKILKDMADVVGYTEKEFDPKKSFRKLLQRLDKQDAGQIDLDSYQDFLFTVLDRYKDVTNKFTFFWLDEAQVFHLFSAYQELMKEIPMFAIDQKAINNITGIFFLIWTIRRYVRWLQVAPKDFQDYTTLWILESLSPQKGLEKVFKNLKKHLGDDGMSDWVLVGHIHSLEELLHDKQQDYCRQIQSWIKTGKVKNYSKVLEKIIEPLRKNNSEVAQIFEIDFLAWRWLSKWLQYIKLEESQTLTYLNMEFQRALQSTDPDNTAIPCREMLLEGSRLPDLRKTFESAAKLLKNPTFIEEWVLRNIIPSGRWPKVDLENSEMIMKVLELSEYRHSGDFDEISTALMQSIDNEVPDYIDRVFKLRYLHGYIPSNYRDTKQWIEFQRTGAPRLELKTMALTILSEADRNWLQEWDSNTINQFRPFGGVNRTRLMVASFRGEYRIVQKLLNEGANQFILSVNDDVAVGDNSSALYLSLLALEAPILLSQQEYIENVILLLLGKMQEAKPDLVLSVMNVRHTITKRTVLNIAIDLGKLTLTNSLLSLGADCNAEIGGDDRTPIYESINAYGRFVNIKTYSDFKKHSRRTTPNHMRMEAGPAALRAIEMEAGRETSERLMKKSFDFLQKQKSKSITPYERIIRTLVEHGADLNKLNSNGWYPMDMAIEIGDSTLIQLITRLGAYKRAIL